MRRPKRRVLHEHFVGTRHVLFLRAVKGHHDLTPQMPPVNPFERVLKVGELVNTIDGDDELLLFGQSRQLLDTGRRGHEVAPADRRTLEHRAGQYVRDDQVVGVLDHAGEHAVRIGVDQDGTAKSDERRERPAF